MQRRSALDSSGLPPALLKATPRDVRVERARGASCSSSRAALVVGGMWGGIVLGRRAEIAERHVGLFASERIVTAGDVIRLQKRGGDDNDHRIIAHYRYTARGRELIGTNHAAPRRTGALRRRIARGGLVSPVRTRARAGSTATRLERRRAGPRPPFRRVCGITALVLILAGAAAVEPARQRPAGDGHGHEGGKETTREGTVVAGALRVDDAQRRDTKGQYQHGTKAPPAVGARFRSSYDRDNSFRHSKYPDRRSPELFDRDLPCSTSRTSRTPRKSHGISLRNIVNVVETR